MRNVVKITTVYLIVATLFAGCGGGGSKPPVDNTPPPMLSSDASLSGLAVSTGSFDESFNSGTFIYTQATNVAALSVTPSLSDANATATVNGVAVASGFASDQIALALGSNTITVVVTAENGSTTQTYTVTITRLSNDASLSGLSLSAGDLDQIFQSSLFDYTATVSFWAATAVVTATTISPDASLTINGAAVNSAEPSQGISLDEGSNFVMVVVTAEDGVTSQNYTIAITRQAAGAFAQQAYVKASNTGAGDGFGHSVALSGDTMAVGAEFEDSVAAGINGDEVDNSATNAGAVYVFTRDGAGIWSQQAYIKASNAGAGDYFGWSVALSGNTLAVGAYNEDSSAIGIDGDQTDDSTADTGAVYVFTRDGAGIWSQQAYIKASNTAATTRDGNFGYSVALSGATLAVGARNESTSAFHSGAVYVLTRDTFGDWSHQAFLKASNVGASDWFGWSLALDGDTLVAGAPYEQSAATGINGSQADNSASYSGAAYVFTRDGAGTWSQRAYLKASNTDWGDTFGISVALFGDTLAVGAAEERSAATGINGDQSDNSLSWPGAVYVFTRDGVGTWSQQSYVKASNSGAGDRFGWSVALSGDTLAVAAYGEGSAATGINGDQTDNSAKQAGAVYMFTRDTFGVWSQQAYIKASNTSTSNTPDNDFFGRSMTLDGDTLAVGAKREDSAAVGVGGDQADNKAAEAGAVYMFR